MAVFPGVEDPYDAPTDPELTLDPDRLEPGEAVDLLLDLISARVPDPRG